MKHVTLQILIITTITGTVGTTMLHGQSEKSSKQETQQNMYDFSNLSVARELRSQLTSKPVVVLFGAPSSGKTEQMKLALGKDYEMYDLRSEFVNEEKLKKEDYHSLKKEEFEWLQKNRATILERLVASPHKLIVFDEIDLWKGAPGTEQNQFELKTAQVIIDLAKQLNTKSGKKIVLILHKEGLDSPELNDILKSQLKLDARDIVKTGHLNKSEEELLLNTTSLKSEEQRAYMQLAQGNPAAYVTLLANIADNNRDKNSSYKFDELVAIARKKITVMYKIAKQIDPAVIKDFETIVDASPVQELAKLNPELTEELVKHGVVGMRNNECVISDLVKQVINAKEKK